MMQNSGYISDTEISKFIDESITILRGTKSNATNALADFCKIKWDPTKENIHTFNNKFQNLLNLVLETNPHFSFDQVKFTWIQALPDVFIDLHTKFNTNKLDDKWLHINNSAQLYVRTIEEMRQCNIVFKTTNLKQDNIDRQQHTSKFLKTVPAQHRGNFPSDFPDHNKLFTHVKELVDAGKTKADIEATFKEPYGYKSCWLCRILPHKNGNHRDDNCPLLKNLFKPYMPRVECIPRSTSLSKHLRAKKTSHTNQVASLPFETIQMCYDTGTTPKSLCPHRELFRDFISFQTPKYVSLADSGATAYVTGQEIIDIIINNTYCIGIFAYMAPTCDPLLSSANHLSYVNNKIVGEKGNITISYPTFHFQISALNNFEFSISSGIKSGKPVLWKPNENDLVQRINGNNNSFRIKRLTPDSILPRRCTPNSMGYDVSTSEPTTIPPHSTATVP